MASQLRPPKIDSASFTGPIEIRDSPSRGKGLFTTKQVKAGDLLLCEKEFSYCFAEPPGEAVKANPYPLHRSYSMYPAIEVSLERKQTSFVTSQTS
jgi:hypothetical protein